MLKLEKSAPIVARSASRSTPAFVSARAIEFRSVTVSAALPSATRFACTAGLVPRPMNVVPSASKMTGAPFSPSRYAAAAVSPSEDPPVTRLSRTDTLVGSPISERRNSPMPTAVTLLRFTASAVGPWVRIPVTPSTVAPLQCQ